MPSRTMPVSAAYVGLFVESDKPLIRPVMNLPFASCRTALAGLAVPLLLAGCTPIVANRGNMLDEDRIAQVKPGVSSKNDVFEALGSPSVVSTFDDNTWYYVGQRTEREAFFKPEVTDRKIIEVSLDTAVDVQPLDETTPAAGRELTFMEQLLGNIGRPSSKKKKKGGEEGG
jgi:outer membrane protein assembly factor BamE (lipoprotein component of BamABCDE complex)